MFYQCNQMPCFWFAYQEFLEREAMSNYAIRRAVDRPQHDRGDRRGFPAEPGDRHMKSGPLRSDVMCNLIIGAHD